MEQRGHTLFSSIGLLILRVGMGGFMMTHGWGKMQMWRAGDFANFPDPLKIGDKNSLMLAATAEFICPILVILGLATRLAAIGPVVAMGVAAFMIHVNDPWYGAPPSKEPALLFLTGFLTLFFTGAGRYSVDHMIVSRRRQS
jgi:putative oxidoreductase